MLHFGCPLCAVAVAQPNSRPVESHSGARETIISTRGPITTSFPMRQDRGVKREDTCGGVSPHYSTRGLGERRNFLSSPAGSGAEPWPRMDFMHI